MGVCYFFSYDDGVEMCVKFCELIVVVYKLVICYYK